MIDEIPIAISEVTPEFLRRLQHWMTEVRDALGSGVAVVPFSTALAADSVRVAQRGLTAASNITATIAPDTAGAAASWYAPLVTDITGTGFTIRLRATAARTGAVNVHWRVSR